MSMNNKFAVFSAQTIKVLLLSTALLSISANSASVNSGSDNNVMVKNSDIPIRFAKGAFTSTVTGRLKTNEDEHWYRFDAAHLQYTVINIMPLAGTPETANVGVLHMPDGTQEGTKGGIIYQGCLPATGTYRLRIARNLMATHGKTAGYKAEIMILPKYASKSLCENQ